MGSYSVELKRIASRRLLKQVPGLQDVKNGSKRTEHVGHVFASGFDVPVFLRNGSIRDTLDTFDTSGRYARVSRYGGVSRYARDT